ncbi:MAG TPA: DUF4124 domain-containing protein, partial [Methylotenera sp.]|nr:DUF4124 domain-containing protein [Methylotenera sp.]
MKLTSNHIQTIGYILSLSGIMLVSNSSKAEIFKWKDANGVIQFSDLAPSANSVKPASNQLKALLAAQTMCSADDMPKAVTALKVNATKTQVASAFIPVANNKAPTQFANLALNTTTTTTPKSLTSIIQALKVNTATTTPTTTTQFANLATTVTWTKCADEWATCQFTNSTKTVKYGGGTSWL